jgi:hypothetical protein
MKLLKTNKDIKKAVMQDEEDTDDLEEEIEEDESEEDEEEQEEKTTPKPLFGKKEQSKEETKPDGTIEPALLPMNNGFLQPGWNIWVDKRKIFTTEELIALMASRIFRETAS